MNALFGAMNLVLAASEDFQPQDEFELPAWVSIQIGPLDMSINKAVVYLFVGAAVTMILGIWVMRVGLAIRPNRRQTIGESIYDLIYGQIAESSLPTKGLSLWFPYVAALFLFIWVVNLIGFIPLPISDEHFHVAGVELPTWGVYAATANLSIPLVLTLVVWFAYNIEGVRKHGFIGYLKTFVPGGITGFAAIPLFVIEVISHLVRIISLSVRLFANILAGHLLILFMAGGLAVLLGLSALGVLTLGMAIPFFLFEVGLVATLQAFIFATLTSIYIGGAVAEGH